MLKVHARYIHTHVVQYTILGVEHSVVKPHGAKQNRGEKNGTPKKKRALRGSNPRLEMLMERKLPV